MDLKTEFLEIQHYYVGKQLTRVMMEEINYRYSDLFARFGLPELQWELSSKDGVISFTPIRPIDKYAICGMLNIDADVLQLSPQYTI